MLVLKVTFLPGAEPVFAPPGVHDHVHDHSPVLSFLLSGLRTCSFSRETPHFGSTWTGGWAWKACSSPEPGHS